jgi:hypothetical protein
VATWKVQLEIESSEAPARITATAIVTSDKLVDTLNEGMDAVVDLYEDDEDEDDEQADRIKHIVGNDTCCAACYAEPLRPEIHGEPLRPVSVPVRLVVLG